MVPHVQPTARTNTAEAIIELASTPLFSSAYFNCLHFIGTNVPVVLAFISAIFMIAHGDIPLFRTLFPTPEVVSDFVPVGHIAYLTVSYVHKLLGL